MLAPVPPLPSPQPQIITAQCPGQPQFVACYRADDQRIYLTGPLDWFVLMHEMGHAADLELDDTDRDRFRALDAADDRGGEWQPPVESAADPAERFADAYAHCRLGTTPTRRSWRHSGYRPSPTLHARVCRFITHALTGDPS